MLQDVLSLAMEHYFITLLLLYCIMKSCCCFGCSSDGKIEEYPNNVVVPVTSEKILDDAVFSASEEGKLVIVDFYASWCGPCRNASPVFGKISIEFAEVLFLKVDVDSMSKIQSTYNVRALPTFLFLKNGSEVDRMVGWSERSLRTMIQKHSAPLHDKIKTIDATLNTNALTAMQKTVSEYNDVIDNDTEKLHLLNNANKDKST